jgi:putative transposase
MIFPVVDRLAADGLPIAVSCRLLKVSTSGFHDWKRRPPSARAQADAELTALIVEAHTLSRGTYGSPRVHAELTIGMGVACGRKRVERLMRNAGLQGISRRRRRGCTKRNPFDAPADDLVDRQVAVDGPDQLWVADITQHRTDEGWVYGAFVLDAWSRRVLGWSLGDHCRTELVADALDMALWRRQGADGCIHHSDHGCQYTSWAFGHRLREAGLRGSMGTVGDAYDNAMAESFFATLQTELLDRQRWTSREQLAQAIFDFVEAFYNPTRRHTSLGMLSPNTFEHQHTTSAAVTAA